MSTPKRKTVANVSLNTGNIKVCVRVRPFLPREKDEKCCVQMPSETQVTLDDGIGLSTSVRHFDFDRAYWSCNDSHSQCATQETLMADLGNDILDNAMDGFNNCLFAYGQTGSGKTHSVLGSEDPPENRGLLPRILRELFKRIEENRSEQIQFQCEVSYLEIYQEQIRDLLVPLTDKPAKLTVRHHPKLGIYVGGLTTNAVTTYAEVQSILDFGVKSRSVAATQMNSASSRSHCLFNFLLLKREKSGGVESEQRASVNLVDLAGSERQKKTGASGSLLKEGAMINQSLSNLAMVINKLAADEGKADFVPFRNSKLTHILQESLSGNSKTVMMAALSPALSNHDETLSTLKFAQTCKNVSTKAVRNQASSAAIAEELSAEISRLKEQLAAQRDDSVLQQQLADTEQLLANMKKDYQAQIDEAKMMEALRKQALSDMGLSLDEISGALGMDRNVPQLVNLSEDASLTGCLVYFLPEGKPSTIGTDKNCTIVHQGVGMQPYMCSLENEGNDKVTLQLLDVAGAPLAEPPQTVPLAKQAGQPGRVLVNGQKPRQARLNLKHQDRLNLGLGHSVSLRLMVPLAASPAEQIKSQGTLAEIEDHLFELLHGDADSFNGARPLIQSILEQAGQEETNELLQTCARILPLVEEGNLITSHVRPKERLEFRVAVGLDVLSAKGVPEVLVSLYKLDDDDNKGNALHFYELEDFEERLEYMRKIYQDTSLGIYPDFRHLADDPWCVCQHDEIQDLMLEVNNARDEAAFNREKAEARASELGEELESAKEQLDELLEEQSGLRAKLHAADTAAKSSMEAHEMEKAALHEELLSARGELHKLQEESRAQHKALGESKAAEEVAQVAARADAKAAALETEMTQLREELQLAKAASARAAQELQLAKDASENASQELNNETKERSEVESLQQELRAQRAEFESMQEELRKSRSAESALSQSNAELQKQMDSAQQSHLDVMRSLGQMRGERDKLQKELEAARGGARPQQSSFWSGLNSVMCAHAR